MKRAQRDRGGVSRGQLALVGVLALVLVYVVASNLGGTGPSGLTPTAVEAVAPGREFTADDAAQTVQPKSPDNNPFGEFVQDKHWPAPSLEKLISFDPLAAPAWMAPAEMAATVSAGQEDATTVEELRNADSAIIFIADGQRVARIGSQDYHVGDFVGPYQITDISSAGIVLSEPTLDR